MNRPPRGATTVRNAWGSTTIRSTWGKVSPSERAASAWPRLTELMPARTVSATNAPQYRPSGALLIHYGSPVVTSHNAVILPLKTGATVGFRIEARAGRNGGLIWSALPELQWFFEAPRKKPAAIVLAEHPRSPARRGPCR